MQGANPCPVKGFPVEQESHLAGIPPRVKNRRLGGTLRNENGLRETEVRGCAYRNVAQWQSFATPKNWMKQERAFTVDEGSNPSVPKRG